MAGGKLPTEETDEVSALFAEINITPLTDIFLVLLIIFMVGASMAVDAASGPTESEAQKSGVKVDLPRGASKDLAPGAEDVTLAILVDGRILLDGTEVAEEELLAGLRTAHDAHADATVILQADEGVPHGRVVAVMERARAAGFSRLAVATRAE